LKPREPANIGSMLTINDRPVFRMGLTKEQAKLISQYMVKEYAQNAGDTGPGIVQVWDYLVEVPGRDGQPVRLTIRVKGIGFDLPEPGHMVPVLVNRRRTKAAFDVDDPSISRSAQYDQGAKQRKAKAAADKAEFDSLRSGKDERRS
jgi:hypothetical protein